MIQKFQRTSLPTVCVPYLNLTLEPNFSITTRQKLKFRNYPFSSWVKRYFFNLIYEKLIDVLNAFLYYYLIIEPKKNQRFIIYLMVIKLINIMKKNMKFQILSIFSNFFTLIQPMSKNF